MKHQDTTEPRFGGIQPFADKVWLSSPTMHGDEQKWVEKAIRTNWVSTIGENIEAIEAQIAEKTGRKHCVALSSGTAALHLCMKLAGEKLYGQPRVGHGALEGRRVFCSDMTFDATVNPVVYEGGEPVFIDTEYDTWNMDPKALEKAFERYPEVKLVVMAHLYGTPAKMDEIQAICKKHQALLIEDAAESFGAAYRGNCASGDQSKTEHRQISEGRQKGETGDFIAKGSLVANSTCLTNEEPMEPWKQSGSFGDYSVLSANGNKIITGSTGGMFLSDDLHDVQKVRKWSTQSREAAPWYQHEELGYNYRMSNIVAGVIRGQLPYLEEHIAQKKAIYERYIEGFKNLPVQMNPMDLEHSIPNYWLSCLLIEKEAMCRQVRSETEALYISEPGKSCPTEILKALAAFNAEGRPIWKPMHMQPMYRMNAFVTREGNGRAGSNAYIAQQGAIDAGADIFARGLCLPSDNKITAEQQDRVIEIIHRCFRW